MTISARFIFVQECFTPSHKSQLKNLKFSFINFFRNALVENEDAEVIDTEGTGKGKSFYLLRMKMDEFLFPSVSLFRCLFVVDQRLIHPSMSVDPPRSRFDGRSTLYRRFIRSPCPGRAYAMHLPCCWSPKVKRSTFDAYTTFT